MYQSLFIITFFIIFATYFIQNKAGLHYFMEKDQYFELFFASLLLVLFFGYFQMLMSGNSSYLPASLLIATFFLIWYFFTKTIVNTIHRDQNLVLHTT